MATSWSKVFNKFLILVDDRELCSSLTDEELTEILSLYLNESYSTKFKKCRKDLTNIQEPDFYTQSFTADGISSDFTISQYPSSPHADAIIQTCTVNGVNANFTFDSGTLTYTVTDSLGGGETVICGYEYVGEFLDDLGTEEDEICWVLAHSMILSWNTHILNNEKKMRERLTTRDFHSLHSPSNLIQKLMELRRISHIELRNLLVSYSFESTFSGFN